MSAIARLLKRRGLRVRGTDQGSSPETERLIAEGIEVHIGHSGDLLETGDALVLSDAIDLARSPEFSKARELGIPVVRRSQVLGWLPKGRKVIAVTGTHGKTTITGMLGSGLIAAGLDPLIVAGANIPQFGGPVREGDGEWAVVEACEAYDSLRDIDPTIVLLSNLEADHLDFHGTFSNLQSSVLRFVARIPDSGYLVYCAADEGGAAIAAMATAKKIPYAEEDFAHLSDGAGIPLQRGHQNMLNAAGALVAMEAIGVTGASAAAGVVGFTGAERRQQVLLGGAPDSALTVIDDYAHHPTEIRESLAAIRSSFLGAHGHSRGRLIVVFQPHLYSRTAALLDQFADALSTADEVVITDIYPAREDPIPGLSSARIAEKIRKPVHYVPSRHLLAVNVARWVEAGDVLVGMGAGNISEFGPALVLELARLYDGGKSNLTRLDPAGRPLKIAVLYGGDSAEREVSIHSGRAIYAALSRLGYDSRLIDMTERLHRGTSLADFIGPERPDVAFLAVHGTHAEDGAIQGLLELLNVPYTGSGIQASAIAMDKALTKTILMQHGIRVPNGALLTEPEMPFDLQPPVIVKPNAQGSTVGLSFVEERSQVCHALLTAFQYDDAVLVEEWIKGMEISTPVLCGRALPPVEIAPVTGKYDFESKYTPGATEEVVPARLPEHLLNEAKEIALRAHRALGCSGATRTDMIVAGEEIYVLEVNTLPGMTGTSLLPNSAAAAGIGFDALCRILVEDALVRHAQKA